MWFSIAYGVLCILFCFLTFLSWRDDRAARREEQREKESRELATFRRALRVTRTRERLEARRTPVRALDEVAR